MLALTTELNITRGSAEIITAQPFAQNLSSTMVVLRFTSGDRQSGIPYALDVARRLGPEVASVGGRAVANAAESSSPTTRAG